MTKGKWHNSRSFFDPFPTRETVTDTGFDLPVGNWTTKAIIPLGSDSPNRRSALRLLNYEWREDRHFEVTLQQSHVPTLLLNPERVIAASPDYLCGVYLPEHQLIQFGRIIRDNLAIHSNLFYRNQLRIYFDDLPKGSFQAKEAQLVIFHSTEIGAVSIPFQKVFPAFVPSGRNHRKQWTKPDEKLYHSGELALWIRKHRPSPEASPSEVTRFLEDYARLDFFSHQQFFWEIERIAPLFAPLVENHLPLFLNQIAVFDHHSGHNRVFARAISLGATPEQKQAVVEAAWKTPLLMNCLLERGWYQEGEKVFRKHLLKMNSGSEYQLAALRGLLAGKNPSNDRLLLELVAEYPSSHFLHHIVRTPHLNDALQKSSLSTWQPPLFALPPSRTSESLPPKLTLALTLGDENALPDLFAILRFARKTDRSASIENHLQGLFLPPNNLPDLLDNQELIGWILKHDPADFQFDPVLRRFILRSNNSKNSN
ncbi:hypothetical protein [Roseibacillus persicicus]|uniref:Uncharacterized protein n=1 Tax=Roseibacillus persicicus TaxID=454148 RepID=A0A918WH27_9BACT|nr:hypothetical protein [Roseibacillus persicicus]GHC46008.1 hypothetical protein GCM10007100_09380 [Roseibacillus persicicus]